MNTKEIIVSLIHADMMLYQFKAVVQKSGIEINSINLNLIDLVARLMGIGESKIPDAWIDLYYDGLGKSEAMPVDPDGNNLYPLAEKCYETLKNFSF